MVRRRYTLGVLEGEVLFIVGGGLMPGELEVEYFFVVSSGGTLGLLDGESFSFFFY